MKFQVKSLFFQTPGCIKGKDGSILFEMEDKMSRWTQYIGELKKLDIYRTDLRLLQSLYWNQFACIRVEGECSEYINIRRGVRQGCFMSPDLFNMYSEVILRESEDENAIQVGGHSITSSRYADDTVLFSESEKDLQRLLNVVVKRK